MYILGYHWDIIGYVYIAGISCIYYWDIIGYHWDIIYHVYIAGIL